MSEEQPRPGQATLAGALIVGGSVFVVLAAWQRISSLHTLEVQEELQRILTEPMTADLGMDVDALSATIRVLCMIGAGAATASAILGIQVFRRSASARIALTALSPLLFVGGLATAGFLAPMVLAGIALLWLQPTRDWYAGRPWIQRYEERRAARLAALRPPAPQSGPVPPQSASPMARPVPAPGVPHAPLPFDRQRPVVGPRPPALVAACAITCAVAVAMVLLVAAMAAYVSANSAELFAEVMKDQPSWLNTSDLTEDDLVAGTYVLVAGAAACALGAIVLAALAFVGQNWARIVLAIGSASGAALSLFLALGAWPLVILVAAFAGIASLLMRPEVARWYVGR
ncbi:hypothetical protein [Nocardioides daeguensis]|uniref:DUF4064 domain-containing protein n=1 Tax=Nocardioides daeguensis TaxID=908359 RepID=A0ABP6VA88_9ACTN|nr:hypothetical protein [Nocardioides daeguensis]MBV6726306.1 hypothetical protein [Nocardioides daeguensis]MCR1772149.1 hypothetical protein [Nocardioides daeguensis]